MNRFSHSEVIDRLGGTTAVARRCRVSTQAVSKWRRDGIPPARLMFLELACPQVFCALPAPPEAA